MLRVFNHYVSMRKLALFVAESSVIGLACAGGALLVSRTLSKGHLLADPRPALSLATLAVLFVPVFQLTLYLTDLYNLRVAQEDRAYSGGLVKAVGLAVLAVGLVTPLLRMSFPAGALLGGAVGALGGALLVRANMATLVGEPRRLLVVGTSPKMAALLKLLEQEGEGSHRVVSAIEVSEGDERAATLDLIAKRLRADDVVFVGNHLEDATLAASLMRCRFEGLRVYDATGFCERVLRRLPVLHLHAEALAYADELRISTLRRSGKRAFDLVIATLVLILTTPLMLIAALAVVVDSRGSVFYRQERVGRCGRVFRLWKFRSMRTDAERNGAVWASANDARVTRVGRILRRTRVDEIPQVFNVLLGQMSFVGPRPERPVFVERLKAQIPFYEFREGVKPGITGWAQIRYPYGASVEDARNKLEYDLYYVKNGSLFLDLGIIFHTARHVLTGRGAR